MEQHKSSRPPVVRLLLLAAALTASAMLGGTTARYLKDWSKERLISAERFYFVSKELREDELQLLTANEKGRAEFSFKLQNYIVAEYPTPGDISYTCKVTDSQGAEVTEVWWRDRGAAADGTQGTLTGKLSGGSGDDRALICSIPKSCFGTDGKEELTITVSTTAPTPYTAALSTRAALSAAGGGVRLVVTDPGSDSGAVSVALYNTDSRDHTGTLTWPKEDLELVLDPSWEVRLDAGDALTVKAGEVRTIVFLERGTGRDYSESDFRFEVK